MFSAFLVLQNPEKEAFARGALRKFVANCAPQICANCRYFVVRKIVANLKVNFGQLCAKYPFSDAPFLAISDFSHFLGLEACTRSTGLRILGGVILQGVGLTNMVQNNLQDLPKNHLRLFLVFQPVGSRTELAFNILFMQYCSAAMITNVKTESYPSDLGV